MAWRYCLYAPVGRDMALLDNRGATEDAINQVATAERATPPGTMPMTHPNAPQHRYELDVTPYESPSYGRVLLIWPSGVGLPALPWVEACIEALGGTKGH